MLKPIFAFLKPFNLFQSPIQFFIDSEKRISSAAGSILSILIFATLLFLFINSNMMNHTNPNIFDQIVSNDAPIISLDNVNFAPVISISEDIIDTTSSSIFDPSYFTVSVAYTSVVNYQSIETPINYHECSGADFNGTINIEDYYQGSYCFDNTEIIQLSSTEKDWFGNMNFLNITLSICSNKTSNGTCKPLDQIFSYLKGRSFNLNFLESFFDLENYDNPIKPYYGNYLSTYINPDFRQRTMLFIMQSELTKEDSFFDVAGTVEKYVQEDATQNQNDFEYISNRNFEEDPVLVEFNIYASLQKRSLRRRYQKITELMSSLGGMASILLFFGRILAEFFINIKFLSIFINKLYNVREDKDDIKDEKLEIEHEKIQLNESSMIKIQSVNERNKKDMEIEILPMSRKKDVLSEEKDQKEINKKEDKVDESLELKHQISSTMDLRKAFKKKTHFYKIYMWDYLKFFLRKIFCKEKMTTKDKIIKMAEINYKKDFGIYTILKKLQEVENLKTIILNKRQCKIFKLIQPPMLNIDNLENLDDKKEILGGEDVEDALKFYNKKNWNQFSEIDFRIMDLINKNQS